MTKHVPSNHEVETFTGRYMDTSNPSAAVVDIDDIAHALSQICRYGGHCQRFYSVAEHAVFVSKRLERRGYGRAVCFAGLHHDDAEAYLGDIPRPMKGLLGDAYRLLTDNMDKAICEYLSAGGPPWIQPQHLHEHVVKDADNWSLFVEAKHLLPSQGINWAGSQLDDWGVRQDGLPSRIVVPDYWHGGLHPHKAKRLYLKRHAEIKEMGV